MIVTTGIMLAAVVKQGAGTIVSFLSRIPGKEAYIPTDSTEYRERNDEKTYISRRD